MMHGYGRGKQSSPPCKVGEAWPEGKAERRRDEGQQKQPREQRVPDTEQGLLRTAGAEQRMRSQLEGLGGGTLIMQTYSRW